MLSDDFGLPYIYVSELNAREKYEPEACQRCGMVPAEIDGFCNRCLEIEQDENERSEAAERLRASVSRQAKLRKAHTRLRKGRVI